MNVNRKKKMMVRRPQHNKDDDNMSIASTATGGSVAHKEEGVYQTKKKPSANWRPIH